MRPRLTLAFATLVALVLGFAAPTAAQSPAAAAVSTGATTGTPPSRIPDEPPPGAPDEAESDEDAAPEPIDTTELKKVDKPKTHLKSAKEQKKPQKLSRKINGHPACGGRVPLYEHEIVDGDMLGSIAARYGVRMSEVQKLNPGLKANSLRIGKKIKVCPEIAPRLREEFTYTVKSGDSLSKIGEKYGLLAKEIVKLQRGKLRQKLEKDKSDLHPGDELTLIVDGGVLPEFAPKNEDRGTLKVGVQLEPGKGYFIKRPHLAYGTAMCVKAIKAALSRYRQTKVCKGGPDVHVGDISARGGGPLKGHMSHQKGIDVDVGLVLKGADADEVRFRTGNEGNLDVPRTWALIKAFVDNADVRAVFLDYRLQKLLYEHARKQKVPESKLDELFQYPRGKGRNFGIIRHWKGHKDHFHVRFRR
jgi:LysM repeat protein